MNEQFVNNISSTLASGITGAATTLTVASATGFPTSGNFRILVDSEYMLVTAVSGTTFTVTRGVEGSSNVSHSSGAAVTCILTAGSLQQGIRDTVGFCGQLTPPVSSLFSWVNQGGATTVNAGPGLYLNAPGGGSAALRMQVVTAPATPYTLTIYGIPHLTDLANTSTVFPEAGIGFYESATSKISTIHWINSSFQIGGNWFRQGRVETTHWNSPTSFNAVTAAFGTDYIVAANPWLQLHNDGTTLKQLYSPDGVTFRTLYSEALASFFTTGPDQIFFYANADAGTDYAGLTLLSWLVN